MNKIILISFKCGAQVFFKYQVNMKTLNNVDMTTWSNFYSNFKSYNKIWNNYMNTNYTELKLCYHKSKFSLESFVFFQAYLNFDHILC